MIFRHDAGLQSKNEIFHVRPLQRLEFNLQKKVTYNLVLLILLNHTTDANAETIFIATSLDKQSFDNQSIAANKGKIDDELAIKHILCFCKI